jgi:uncharacterized protein YehS (DUF1456 family)
MMENREIKYKIYDNELKDFVEDANFMWSLSRNGKLYDARNDKWYTVGEKYIILFYTGLKSCGLNEMPIIDAYFNDIIKFFNTDGNEIIAVIIWYKKEECLGFKRISDGFVYTQRHFNDSGYFQPSIIQFEIIGNTFDNADLIK